ncbi:DUF4089 domain-containing protein [Acetobacter indonesiensis]|jgi:hypothetical protein|uniref:DUF4089 domain-containing protein n=1 Tax=Acetobacter indonesiensis TaxID=104101 RepID=UPI0039EBC092
MSENEMTVKDIMVIARQIGLSIPEQSVAGVLSNSQLLRGYCDLICSMDLPDDCLPAYEYRP